MAGTFMLNVVAPAGEVLNQEVEFVVVPGVDGEIGVLANHAPLIASLAIGVMRYTQEGRVKYISIGGGFFEVADNRVVALVKTAERQEDIDLERAECAKARAEKRLQEKLAETDLDRAEVALKRAAARIRVSNLSKM